MGDVRIETAERVMTITLDRAAKKNAITDAMYGDIAAALNSAASDPAIGAVLICGDGPDFCAGNDISMFAASASGESDISRRSAPSPRRWSPPLRAARSVSA
jgi:enoyl-CoA hydratase/carnithine racemase